MPEPAPQIRSLAAADVRAAVAIDRQVAINPWSEGFLAGYADQPPAGARCALVLEQGGKVIAFVALSLVIDEASIDNIAVHPEHQRHGCGAELLRAAMAALAARGARRCLLEVRQSSLAARAFYQNNGFSIDGVRPRYYRSKQGREDALLMSRRL